MNKHKWAKEIKAWADGAEIEWALSDKPHEWLTCNNQPSWGNDNLQFRIKPQTKESEFAQIPYWLCCGSLDIRHHATSCSEAKAGYPERCRFGTVEEHQKRMEKPKEPQYLYVYGVGNECQIHLGSPVGSPAHYVYIGKIKLESDDAE